MSKKEKWFMLLNGIQKDTYALNVQMVKFNDSLATLQKLVDGHIEHYIIDDELDSHKIDMWINEEGKFREDFKPVFGLFYDGKLYDVIVGPCVFSKYDNQGNTLGLNDDDMYQVREFLRRCPMIEIRTTKGEVFPCLRVDK